MSSNCLVRRDRPPPPSPPSPSRHERWDAIYCAQARNKKAELVCANAKSCCRSCSASSGWWLEPAGPPPHGPPQAWAALQQTHAKPRMPTTAKPVQLPWTATPAKEAELPEEAPDALKDLIIKLEQLEKSFSDISLTVPETVQQELRQTRSALQSKKSDGKQLDQATARHRKHTAARKQAEKDLEQTLDWMPCGKLRVPCPRPR